MIEIDNISYSYEDSGRAALSGVTLSIKKGEFLAVVGHNGSGKSTLAKHLNALLLPTEGTVRVAGMDTKDEANTLPIRQKVGMVFQNPDNQLVTTVVEEDVAFGPENLGVPGAEIRARVDAALAAVGMEAVSYTHLDVYKRQGWKRPGSHLMRSMYPTNLWCPSILTPWSMRARSCFVRCSRGIATPSALQGCLNLFAGLRTTRRSMLMKPCFDRNGRRDSKTGRLHTCSKRTVCSKMMLRMCWNCLLYTSKYLHRALLV